MSQTKICTWPDCEHTAKGQCRVADIVYCPPNVDCLCYARLVAENERLAAEAVRLREEIERLKNRPIGQVKLDGPVW